MSLTVVLANYMRSQNVRRLIQALSQQTVKPTLFVWDNSSDHDCDDPRIDWLIRSSQNAKCSPRWWMASHANTDFVLIHDDDLLPSHPMALGRTLDAAVKIAPFAVGAAGVIVDSASGYWLSRHVGVRATYVDQDTQVDIVKGCYFCCPTIRLRELGYLELDSEDDIIASAKLGNNQSRPHLVLADLQNNLQLLPEGEFSRKTRPCHRTAREAARRKYFRSH
jgi:hypothetical protein